MGKPCAVVVAAVLLSLLVGGAAMPFFGGFFASSAQQDMSVPEPPPPARPQRDLEATRVIEIPPMEVWQNPGSSNPGPLEVPMLQTFGFPETEVESKGKVVKNAMMTTHVNQGAPHDVGQEDTPENSFPLAGSFSICNCEMQVDRPQRMDYGVYYYGYYQKLHRCAEENCAICQTAMPKYFSQDADTPLVAEAGMKPPPTDPEEKKEYRRESFCISINKAPFDNQIPYEKCLTLMRQLDVYDKEIKASMLHEVDVALHHNTMPIKQAGQRQEEMRELVRQQAYYKACKTLGCC